MNILYYSLTAVLLLSFNVSAQTITPAVHLVPAESDGKTICNKVDSSTSYNISYGKLRSAGKTKALQFNGHITHLELPDTRNLTFDKGITITAWICPVQMLRNTVVLGRPNPTPEWTTPTLGLYFPSPDKLGVGIWTAKKCRLEADTEIKAGEWIFATCTWDRKTARVYINGELKGEEPCTGKLPPFRPPFTIGCGGRSNPFYKGEMGEVRIYQEAISADEIKSIYHSDRFLYTDKPHKGSSHQTITVQSKKNSSDQWHDYATRTLSETAGFTPGKAEVKLSKYGGWLAKKSEATGFFRAEKIGDRWWMIDPEGFYFIHIGVACVRVGNSAQSIESYKELYGSREKWSAESLQLLRDNHFNGIGNWSDHEDLRAAAKPLPYTIRGGFLSRFAKSKGLLQRAVGHSGYAGDVPPMLVPGFKEFCKEEARVYRRYREDPYLAGVFSDNEIIPANLENFLALDQQNPLLKPSYDAALNWLRQHRGTDDISLKPVTRMERMEFDAYAFAYYFKVVSEAIKQELPNHMYLGSRLHGPSYRNPFVVQACGQYADIVSINYYNEWNPDSIEYWEQISGKPMMITEFYTKGEDSGLPNKTGAGWIVPTQADRGRFYQNFILGLLESKGCVGWHWFKYMDNDPDNKKADPSNIDSNKGIIKIDFKPYTPLLKAMQEINREVYPLTEFFDQ